MLGLNLSSILSEVMTNSQGTAIALSGLSVSKTGSNAIRIGPGAYYESRAINAGTTDTIIKQALITVMSDFNVPSPTTAGTSIVYTIEGQFVELDNTTMTTSTVPYVDATNTYLPSIILNGELKLSLLAGVAAATGSEVPAATSAGKFPIYNITLTQGSTAFKVQLHASAPTARGMLRSIIPNTLTTGGATKTAVNDVPVYSMDQDSISGISLTSSLSEVLVNPYLPIKVRISYTNSVAGGQAIMRLRYKAYAAADLITAAEVVAGSEPVPMSSTANSIQTYTTQLSVPVTEFATFVNGVWKVNREFINIIIERMGSDASDTNGGLFQIVSASLTQ
jgi:hypothetical protein